MAVNMESLKNPKVLIVIGVAAVGGIYLASRMKSRQNAENVPQEVGVTYATESVESVEEQDRMQRELTAAYDKQKEVERLQQDAEKRYQDSIKDRQSERDSFNQRLIDEKAKLGSEYGSQLSQLQQLIRDLERRLNEKQSAPVPGQTTQPVPQQPQQQQPETGKGGGNQGPITPRPDRPLPSDTPRGQYQQKSYPGLPNGFVMDCGNYRRGLIYSSFDAAVADQKKKGNTTIFLARNLSTIAITGATTPWIYGYDALLPGDPRRVQINVTRAQWGLHPLTDSELDEMRKHMQSLWPSFKDDTVLRNLSYARALWERWNRPYQCGSSAARHGG